MCISGSNVSIGCESGLYIVNGKCELCERGSYSLGYSTQRCQLCDENFYAPISGSSACIPCGSGKESALGSSTCTDQDSAWKTYGVPTVTAVLPTLIVGYMVWFRHRIMGSFRCTKPVPADPGH